MVVVKVVLMRGSPKNKQFRMEADVSGEFFVSCLKGSLVLLHFTVPYNKVPSKYLNQKTLMSDIFLLLQNLNCSFIVYIDIK